MEASPEQAGGGVGPGARGALLLVAGAVGAVLVTVALAFLVVPRQAPSITVDGVELRPNQMIVLGLLDPSGTGTGAETISKDVVFSRVIPERMPDGPDTGEFAASWVGSAGQRMQISGVLVRDQAVVTGEGISVNLSFEGLTFISNSGECTVTASTLTPDVAAVLACEELASVNGAASIEMVANLSVPRP